MILGASPLVPPGYSYYASNGRSSQGQQQLTHQTQHLPLTHQSLLHATASTPANNIYYYNPNANYAYQQPPLTQLAQRTQTQKLSNYDYSTGSTCSSRSSSISVSPVVNKSQIRLPPISTLVPAAVYGQEQLAPSTTAYQVGTSLPAHLMVMNDSPRSSFLPAQHSHCQHSHTHSHTNCQHSHTNCQHSHNLSHFQHSNHHTSSQSQYLPVSYNTGSAELSMEPTMAHNLQSEILKPQQQLIPSNSTNNTNNDNFNENNKTHINTLHQNDKLDSAIKYRKQCPVCGKICSRPSTLKTHLLIHTGDTPFKCPWENCNKSFNVKSNMLRHLKSHERKQAKKEGRLSTV